MENILMNVANILIQTVINVYFLVSVSQYAETKKYTKREIAISAGIILIAITVSILLKPISKIISSAIIILSTLGTLTFLLKVKAWKSLIITFISMIVFRNYRSNWRLHCNDNIWS